MAKHVTYCATSEGPEKYRLKIFFGWHYNLSRSNKNTLGFTIC